MHYPPVSEIERISAMADVVERNRLITRSYHQLSLALAQLMPGSANWSTFAGWASRQAGESIRREDLVRLLSDRLKQDPAFARILQIAAAGRAVVLPAIESALGKLQPFRKSSEAVARGNLKVFEEVAPEFARFLDAYPERAPEPESELLRGAFDAYHTASRLADGKERSESILLGNLRIGFHEQTRLQQEIEDALNAVAGEPVEIGRALLSALTAGLEPRTRLGASIRQEACRLLGERVRQVARSIMTEQMMVLKTPGGTLRLGHDLDGAFPEDLATIGNEELAALLEMVDPTPNSLRDTGAADWADFAERMHFIADLFRTRQHDLNLLTEPA